MAEIIVNPAEATAPISVVCGNANAEVIRFTFDRNSDGKDLGGCAWAVTAKNSGGFSDTYMEGHGVEKTVTAGSISVDWTLSGIAVGTAGRTIYQLIGLDGTEVVKQFPYHTLNVLSYLQSSLSTEAEEDMSALWETIEYVGNELPGILDAEAERKEAEEAREDAEDARAAAEDQREENEAERQENESARTTAETGRAEAETARAEAEKARAKAESARAEAEADRAAVEEARAAAEASRAEGFDKIDLYTSKEGRITTVTAVNAQGTVTTSEVTDGKDGTGLTIKALYATLEALQEAHPEGSLGDVYAVGTSEDNVVYIWDVETGSYKNLGALQGPEGPQGPQGIQGIQGPAGQDGEDGQDAPQESVLYVAQTLTEEQKAQARTNIDASKLPTPTPADSGKALVVGSDGKYALGMTSVNTTTDPGAGATSSYPDGTEINVYE